ncbi:MAG: hypothetical protein IT267_01780 [Saprospiraceae bacterium]|nr:hypothetical protein [Saprospiraceae bacterium]
MINLKEVIAHSKELESLILKINFKEIGLSKMGESYFAYNLEKLTYNNQSNVLSLTHILDKLPDKRIDELCLIDHGAGIGFFGLLAKKVGIGNIICHDLSEEMIHDCKIISKILNLEFNYYITGDTDSLVEFCKTNKLMVDGLSSRNVIEHIPDLDQFFELISHLPSSKLVLMISTSANIHNPVVHRLHRNIHKHYEWNGSSTNMTSGDYDKTNSGRNLRRKIIVKYLPELTENQLDKFINNTRGLTANQIINCINQYKLDKTFPVLTARFSNTRDPFTGTWVERLVPFYEYKLIVEKYGFTIESIPGFYNQNYKKLLFSLIAQVLNCIIKLIPNFHRTISPFLAMRMIKDSNR